ncbi:TAXI family TRAP transporter solute-binding subunit [Jannaschia sp. 2305UL9-9]|uniref:TAXI family TRAP transporter solute-binding subunit n=1 Tax=Jannaschia sp. 2305UL9-9 TaxID=3121638 RepID=UPI00352728B1
MMIRLFLTGLSCAVLFLAMPVAAQDERTFRIATAGNAGTYFPIGGLIANAISAPPGSRACDDGGACGVPGLTATAISTNGSVANVELIAAGQMESAFVQSDVVTWAWTGSGIWAPRPPVDGLRAIANLYPESMHVVASAESGITSLADLSGKRVSLDEPGSGTLVEAEIILRAVGVTPADVQAQYLPTTDAANAMRAGQLDAFFFAGGFPAKAVSDLANDMDIVLIPFDEDTTEIILVDHEFLTYDLIPAGTYRGMTADVWTIGVNAQWVTTTDQPDDLIYDVTRALWNSTTRRLLDGGHQKGALVTMETALDGVGIPLHPGAQRFYEETGMLN